MTACGFTHSHYREALAAARRSHAIVGFDATPATARPPLTLRHDVDFCTAAALRLARLESEIGIAATYFVLPHGDYDVLGEGFGDVREIVRLGHALGLHYDVSWYAAHGLDPARTLQRDARLLADVFETPVTVAAEHNPGLRHGPPVDVAPLLDAYSPRFTRARRYLSDSCQFWREGCFCASLSLGEPLQVLVHPIWWSDDGRTADRLLRELTERRVIATRARERAVFDHYASLAHLGNRALFDRDA